MQLQEIFLKDTCLKSREIFLSLSVGNEYCLELYTEALGPDERTHWVMALTDQQYKPDDLFPSRTHVKGDGEDHRVDLWPPQA